MKPKRLITDQLRLFMLVTIALSLTFNVLIFQARAAPSSSYSYRFMVNANGLTNIQVNFTSSDTSGSSWVIVPNPKFSTWNYTVKSGSSPILQPRTVDTNNVISESLYFYQAFMFSWSTGSFSMEVQFDFDDGALIIENRGIFFSPQIGYEQDGGTSGEAEVLFDYHLTVDQSKASAVGTRYYTWTEVGPQRVVFNLPTNENLLRLQVEFTTSILPQWTTLTSKNGIFSFKSPSLYVNQASTILNLYDTLYSNYTRLFNVTLTPLINVQFFLPDFNEFLSLGGFTPFSEAGFGTMNINIFFIRAVNGTIETIAAHELIHVFLIKAGFSPNDFLWFHEGMAQYVSATLVDRLGYEGAKEEKDSLEQSASDLIKLLGGEKFGFLQSWSPSVSPSNVGSYYVASYYVVSRLAQDYGGLDFYKHFFELTHGVKVDNIDTLALYLGKAANADVALTLYGWGFNVIISPEISQKIASAQRNVAAVNPVFQPYKSLAEFLLRQALLSYRRGDTTGGNNLLELALTIADLAPLLWFLTIAAILGIIIYAFYRHREKAKLKPVVPPPPLEIFPKTAE